MSCRGVGIQCPKAARRLLSSAGWKSGGGYWWHGKHQNNKRVRWWSALAIELDTPRTYKRQAPEKRDNDPARCPLTIDMLEAYERSAP